MHQTNQDACSVVFAKGQFSWTKRTPKKLEFNDYQEMVSYYNIKETDQLMRAFDNVDKSQDESSDLKTSSNMTYYYDKTLRSQPKWAHRMQVAYRTQHFVFCNAKTA